MATLPVPHIPCAPSHCAPKPHALPHGRAADAPVLPHGTGLLLQCLSSAQPSTARMCPSTHEEKSLVPSSKEQL